MGERTWTDDGSGEGGFRAAASGAQDAATKAAHYVTETTSEHPASVLIGALGTAALAFLIGYVSNNRSGQNRDDWRKQRRDWQKRGAEISDRVRSAAPSVSEAATNAGEYVTRNVRDYPVLGLLSAAAVGCILGYSLRNRD
jgi:ElaB/YqjD/DUF883 family membrane-anchored ribosome-binding protein